MAGDWSSTCRPSGVASASAAYTSSARRAVVSGLENCSRGRCTRGTGRSMPSSIYGQVGLALPDAELAVDRVAGGLEGLGVDLGDDLVGVVVLRADDDGRGSRVGGAGRAAAGQRVAARAGRQGERGDGGAAEGGRGGCVRGHGGPSGCGARQADGSAVAGDGVRCVGVPAATRARTTRRGQREAPRAARARAITTSECAEHLGVVAGLDAREDVAAETAVGRRRRRASRWRRPAASPTRRPPTSSGSAERAPRRPEDLPLGHADSPAPASITWRSIASNPAYAPARIDGIASSDERDDSGALGPMPTPEQRAAATQAERREGARGAGEGDDDARVRDRCGRSAQPSGDARSSAASSTEPNVNARCWAIAVGERPRPGPVARGRRSRRRRRGRGSRGRLRADAARRAGRLGAARRPRRQRDGRSARAAGRSSERDHDDDDDPGERPPRRCRAGTRR